MKNAMHEMQVVVTVKVKNIGGFGGPACPEIACEAVRARLDPHPMTWGDWLVTHVSTEPQRT